MPKPKNILSLTSSSPGLSFNWFTLMTWNGESCKQAWLVVSAKLQNRTWIKSSSFCFRIKISTSFWLWQKILPQQDLQQCNSKSCFLRGSGKKIIFLSMLNGEDLPKKMLAEFSTLVGTWNRTMPAIDSGILFNDPTRLRIAGN